MTAKSFFMFLLYMKKPVLSTIKLNKIMVRDPIIELLKANKKIGLFVSGGLDSALVLYLVHLLRQELQTDNEFTIYTVSRPNNSIARTHAVVDWISNKFEVKYDIKQVGTDKVHHTLHVISGLREASTDDIDIFILGDTKNPNELPNGPNRKSMNLKRFAQPWVGLTKDHLVQEFINCNVPELIAITYSCEKPDDNPCGECWHCDERALAFAKCGHPDPQTPPRERYIFDVNYVF
jgi:hypothetical protein